MSRVTWMARGALMRLPRARRPRGARTALLALLALGALGGGLVATGAVGGSDPRAVGPTSSEHGYPTWYRDANGVELERCLDPTNALCIVGAVPDPTAPVSFPDNYPDESFYYNLGSSMTTNGGGRARLLVGLESAFASAPVVPGQQITFGRIRYVIDNLQQGADYLITTPYGTDKVTSTGSGPRSIFFTDDVGVPNPFGGALNSRVLQGFVKWGAGAPAGYLGDPTVDHTVIGSPTGTNYFRIVGPNVGGAANANPCPTTGPNAWVPAPGQTAADCVQTDLFQVSGKLNTIGGVDVARATYSRTAAGITLDAFASSKTGQSLELSGSGLFATKANPCPTTGPNAWVPAPGQTAADCVQTDLFQVSGKLNTIGGVDVARATYSRTAAGITLDAFASSKTGQSLELSGSGLFAT